MCLHWMHRSFHLLKPKMNRWRMFFSRNIKMNLFLLWKDTSTSSKVQERKEHDPVKENLPDMIGHTGENNSVWKIFIFSNLILDINIHPNTTGSRVEEELFTTWLNKDEQGMDKHWRRKRFGKHPDRWFKVPVKTTVKQSLRNVDGDDVPRKRNKVIVVNDHKCVTGCLLLCVHYMGLRKHTEQMKKLLNKNLLFEQVLSKFQQAKGFVRHRVVDPFNFKPVVDTDPESLYVVQLSSQCDGNPESKDNFHCVSIFNKLIFDNNIETPLPLSKENLDKCCVGGPSYVFHHCSRVVRFTPTEKKKKLIVKNLSQQNTLWSSNSNWIFTQ